MIEVNNISKAFGDHKVLEKINTQFSTGKANMIIGSSGSGKTVLMKCIVGLLEPDEGEVYYDGRDFTSMNYHERKEIRTEIGMLFQGSALFDSQTVEDNISFPLKIFTNDSQEKIHKRVNFCLERVHLSDVNNLYPAELSGGMKKRVGIARAIAMNPKYLFVDEPNSGLDPQTALVIDNLIRELTIDLNITTIVNSHDMNSVFEMGDHLIFLHNGKNWWEGKPKEIISSKNKELLDFVFASKFMKELREQKTG